jgi:heptosyltransferase I
MALPLTSPPKNLCLLRLSALGDISHSLPILRTIQTAWPETQITWIIGKREHALVGDIPGVDFIIFDKSRRWAAYADLRRALRGRRFDVLLHMQMSLRASLASLLVKADIRLGFDRARAGDMQWLFTNQKIAAHKNQHVLDSFFGFTEALGIESRDLRWDVPIPETAHSWAKAHLPQTRFLALSPCSSMAYRNWNSAGYAAVAEYAIKHHGLKVVLCGGSSALERQYGAEIHARLDSAGCADSMLNLIGETDLKQLLAVLQQASCLLSPDAGPAHLATAVDTPVIGLYACTNPERAGPYLSNEFIVNRYPEAVEAAYAKLPGQLPWGIRVKDPGAMERIRVDDVTRILDRLLETTAATH